MKWQQMSAHRIESPEGYIISKSRVDEDSVVYVARAPRLVGYLYVGGALGDAQAACDAHLVRLELVEVRVCDLQRQALNWAVAGVAGLKVSVGTGADGSPLCMLGDPAEGRVYDPAGDWEQGGPLLDKYCIEDASDLSAACRAVVGMLSNIVKVPAVLAGGDL